MARIERIYRYPVKGLNAELLDSADVRAGEGLPRDRCLALARAETAFDPAAGLASQAPFFDAGT